MNIKCYKYQAVGNAYIVVDGQEVKTDWASLARSVSNPYFGIGSDGLLVLLPSDKADFKMRIFNPDGSEAEMCGNGIRIMARHLKRYSLLPADAKTVSIETLAGIKIIYYKEDDLEVDMGQPTFNASNIPYAIDEPIKILDKEFNFTAVSVGNPHAVFFIDEELDDFPLEKYAKEVQARKDLFPEGVNVEFVNVITPEFAYQRTYERGVGETLGCGTGATAVFKAGLELGLFRQEVTIKLKGGNLKFSLNDEGNVLMRGPAHFIAECLYEYIKLP